MDSGAGEGSGATPIDDYESLISTTDADLLKRAWRNEKAAPEILRFEAALIQRSREQIELMVIQPQTILKNVESTAPDAAIWRQSFYVQEETVEEFTKNGGDPLTVSLYRMDLDRTLFLLRSYLRTRLQKIEKYMFHIRKTPDLWDKLSKQEQKFAKRCTEDMQQHFEQSVLSKMPERYKSHLKQSVISEEDDMVPEPQLDKFVFCRTKRFLYLQVDDSGEENPLDMETGHTYALRYKAIKPLVESGQIDMV